ncbi:hypothetical protein J5N97_008719 [Dioscorea zingiberensis]|uniref:Uncharacterized protein n=1 Tax=Dioscorea zingiberensis TaxID=325984 RepID=A0A9D5HL09_9LILI|nr:hypothetical protein J5N97_008719 [Dioscorea zingiberensis]
MIVRPDIFPRARIERSPSSNKTTREPLSRTRSDSSFSPLSDREEQDFRCSRLHNRPTISPTLLLSNMYQRPDMITPGVDPQGQAIDPRKIQEHFEDFYEDIFEELSKFGEIESLNICDNLADHMVGNVYVQFKEEDQAAAALNALQGRFYSGRPIIADFSPVTDFREATCRQFEENSCNRGGYCNFMHVKQIGRELRRKLFGRYRKSRLSRSRSRSASPHHRRDNRDRRDHRDRDGDRDRDFRGSGRRGRGDRHESQENATLISITLVLGCW